MTTITFLQTDTGKRSPDTLFSRLRQRTLAFVKEQQAQRALDSIPADMRKDFGWPTADMTSPNHPRS